MEDTTAAVTDQGVEEETSEVNASELEGEPTESSTDDDDSEQLDADAEDSAEEDDEEDETIELDFGGNKLKVAKDKIPAEVAEEVQRFVKGVESGYTKKMQALADTNRTVEAREQALQKLEAVQGEALDVYASGLRIKQELAQLKDIDTASLWQSQNPEDRDKARMISDAISSKTAELHRHIQKVDQLESGINQAHQAETARRMDEGRTIMERRVKGFSKEIAPKVVKYVMDAYGVPKDHAETWPLNVAAAEMAYKAMKFDEMQSRLKKQKTQPENKEVTPSIGKPVKGKSGKGRPDPSKMSPQEYQQWWASKNKK